MKDTIRIAVAGRYQERHTIKQILDHAQLDTLPVEITASWMDLTVEGDGDLTDAEAMDQAYKNFEEIAQADLLLYFPSWIDIGNPYSPAPKPNWSPGRLIDYGYAIACGNDIIIVGKPEPSIYFRGDHVTVCTPDTLRETVQKMIEQ